MVYSAATAKAPVLEIIAHAHEISWKALARMRFCTGLRGRELSAEKVAMAKLK